MKDILWNSVLCLVCLIMYCEGINHMMSSAGRWASEGYPTNEVVWVTLMLAAGISFGISTWAIAIWREYRKEKWYSSYPRARKY